MEKVDYIVVGQGLAGSLLTWRLRHAGKRVAVIDDGYKSSSSIVAAGLLNPVTGKRLRLESNIDILLKSAQGLYRQLEKEAGEQFLVDLPILRLVKDRQQRQFLDKRLEDPAYANFIRATQSPMAPADQGAAALQSNTGYINTVPLLTWLAKWISQHARLLVRSFDHGNLRITEKSLGIDDLEAEAIVFCEGYKGVDNPWFNLPFQAAKGEIITVRFTSKEPDRRRVLHKGDWLVPLASGEWRFGATHEWQFESDKATSKGHMELEQRLRQLAPGSTYTITEHKAGVRPATQDRQPFLGRSDRDERLLMFNGFGSKGSLLIPYYSQLFANHLLLGDEIPGDADIQRFNA